MKKDKVSYQSKEENAFSLSTGDLMAGLLFIFILLLMGALLQVQEKARFHHFLDALCLVVEPGKRSVHIYEKPFHMPSLLSAAATACLTRSWEMDLSTG